MRYFITVLKILFLIVSTRNAILSKKKGNPSTLVRALIYQKIPKDMGSTTPRIRMCGLYECEDWQKEEWEVCDPNTICAWLVGIIATIIGVSMILGAYVTWWCEKHEYAVEECWIQ